MARTVQIPVAFEFRTVRVEWGERESRIVGLSWGEVGGWKLKARATGRGRKAEAELSIDDVPSQLWKQCLDAVDNFRHSEDFDNADETIEKICTDFRPRLLVATDKHDFLDDDDDDKKKKYSLPADAWQLRDDFLRVTSEVSSVLRFLNQWGRWDLWGYTQLHRFIHFQQNIRHALVSPAVEWFSHEFYEGPDFALHADLDLNRKSVYPYFAIDTLECKRAICQTITIDLLRQTKFKTCARQDCGQPFPIQSRHKRKFCCWYCGHLASVRKGRANPRSGTRRKLRPDSAL